MGRRRLRKRKEARSSRLGCDYAMVRPVSVEKAVIESILREPCPTKVGDRCVCGQVRGEYCKYPEHALKKKLEMRLLVLKGRKI